MVTETPCLYNGTVLLLTFSWNITDGSGLNQALKVWLILLGLLCFTYFTDTAKVILISTQCDEGILGAYEAPVDGAYHHVRTSTFGMGLGECDLKRCLRVYLHSTE